VRFLDLAARKLFLNVEIKANQPEHNADGLAFVAGSLDGEGVHCVLQDEARAAHRVNVDFVVGGTNGVHIEDSLARDFSTCKNGDTWHAAARMIMLAEYEFDTEPEMMLCLRRT
jgi:hypothetical protein